MQITNNKTTIELNEEKLLNMICDLRIEKLESVFKEKYQVPVITELPEEVFFMFLYLCVVMFDLKANDLAAIYDVCEQRIVRETTKVFTRQQTNTKFYAVLYDIFIMYNQRYRNEKRSA